MEEADKLPVPVSLSLDSLWFSWRRILAIIFLPLISSGLAPRPKLRGNRPSQTTTSSPATHARHKWSHLTPLDLKNRSVGLGFENPRTGNAYFTLDGHKFRIFGGSIHYFRVPREYWRDRLLKLKACGFNTVTTYIPWNLHEPEGGKFDFSGNLDLEAFVMTAGKIGLWVILRPGPYICAEVDLGGLPSRLLRDPKPQLRTTEKGFIDAVDRYFDHLVPRMIPLQYRSGGPVIAFQVENEYGSYNKDRRYMPYLYQALVKRGIVELLLTSDDENQVLKGATEGALATVNLKEINDNSFDQLQLVQKTKPIMIMEYWVGWYKKWGDKQFPPREKEVETTVSEFLKLELSFNVYMFHGGTNFGFMNGAAYDEDRHRGVITSYDYDAVLTEAGDYTEKYFILRELLGSVSETPLPPLPESKPKAVYPSVTVLYCLPLWEILPFLNAPVKSKMPVSMENLPINNGSGQSFGFILYETSVCTAGHLYVHVEDTAQVFLNYTILGFLDKKRQEVEIPESTDCQILRILVENEGRINFSWKLQEENKGIIGRVRLNDVFLSNFTIYSLEMKMDFFNRIRSATWRPAASIPLGPIFCKGILKAGSSPKDTFLSLPDWNNGFVFINGRNLGRYWNIGPQETLYLPGVWLHPGDNEIILLEKLEAGTSIEFTNKHVV
ncbi:beta-galactosidase-1-like protein 3 [Ochotona curzoniae]|uniref:beta-galactosidase-1-like protein 3 n=1 Tax=Ochotona curzoniae TaxID=130825 RepID=UPI001B34CE31|nr:beta-galactosidase-1-like protein 3 [Ochotona curzoniae]